MSGNLLLCWVLRGLPHEVHRDPTFPTATAGEHLHPHQSSKPPASSLTRERGNQHHNKNPARGNISIIPISEEHCWGSRRKKLQTPTTGAQVIKTLTKNNSRCINLNAEWNSKINTLHQKPIQFHH
jgi:hypothetical protein